MDPRAEENLGETIFFRLVRKFINIDLPKCFLKLKTYVDRIVIEDKRAFHRKLHQMTEKLLSTADCVGAGRVHYDCFFMQEHFLKGRYKEQL